jgi:Phycobilisome degradation protein nblA
MNQPTETELPLEKKFLLKSFETQISRMSEAQAKQTLVEIYLAYLAQQTAYNQLLKQGWGIDAIPKL